MNPGEYDEFAYFQENLDEWGLSGPVPPVQRCFVAVDGLRQVSGLLFGAGTPEAILLHGVGQNAHTFDTVALAVRRPLLALDLPGHGHSDTSPFGPVAVEDYASDVIAAWEALAPAGRHLVGMSLGGLVAIAVSDRRPDLVASLTLIDITPGVTPDKSRHVTDFVNGPATFASFDEILARTVEHNPTRSESSLRRGVLHNAMQRPDGTWVWRHQRHPRARLVAPDAGDLWERLSRLSMPVTLVRALGPGSVVDDDDEARFRRLLPHARVIPVPDSGHSVQGDAPVALAEILADLWTAR